MGLRARGPFFVLWLHLAWQASSNELQELVFGEDLDGFDFLGLGELDAIVVKGQNGLEPVFGPILWFAALFAFEQEFSEIGRAHV